MTPGVRHFIHPEHPGWEPIEWTNPTPEQVHDLEAQGYIEVDQLTAKRFAKGRRARPENRSPNPPAA